MFRDFSWRELKLIVGYEGSLVAFRKLLKQTARLVAQCCAEKISLPTVEEWKRRQEQVVANAVHQYSNTGESTVLFGQMSVQYSTVLRPSTEFAVCLKKEIEKRKKKGQKRKEIVCRPLLPPTMTTLSSCFSDDNSSDEEDEGKD